MNNFKSTIVEFDSLGLNKTFINNCDFDEMSKKLRNKDVLIKSYTFFLELFKLFNQHFDKKDTKKILTSFIIISHTNIILNKTNNLNKNIILCSRVIVNKLNFISQILESNQKYLSNQLKLLLNNIKIYINTFDKWKNKDKYLIIDELIMMYYELESMEHNATATKEIKKLVDENTLKEQKKILERIKILGGDEGIVYFENKKQEVSNFQKQIKDMYTNIEKVVHEAFWDDLKHKLSQDEPDLSLLVTMLKDIKIMLYTCVPNRHDIHNKINEELDIKYIEQLIEHKSIDDKLIINYVFLILGYVKQFQSPEDDKEMAKWIKALEKEIENIGYQEFENYIDVSEFFPKVFRKNYNK